MNHDVVSKAVRIIRCREAARLEDSHEYQAKTRKFLNWASIFNYPRSGFYDQEQKIYPENCQVWVSEMYDDGQGDILSSPNRVFQYFNPFANTRKMFPSEMRCEFEYPNPDDNWRAAISTALELINRKIHFVIFYAVGQKSPHIVIYDFEQLRTLSPIVRRRARKIFWQRIVPFPHFSFIDTALFSEHKVCLEFRPHWRHKTIFELKYEWVPFMEEGFSCKN